MNINGCYMFSLNSKDDIPKSPAGCFLNGEFIPGGFLNQTEPIIDRPLTPPLAEDLPTSNYYLMPSIEKDDFETARQKFIQEANYKRWHHIHNSKLPIKK